MQNVGRLPIIEDTARTYRVVENPFGDDPIAEGFYIEELCPVNGASIMPFRARATHQEAADDLAAYLEEIAL